MDILHGHACCMPAATQASRDDCNMYLQFCLCLHGQVASILRLHEAQLLLCVLVGLSDAEQHQTKSGCQAMRSSCVGQAVCQLKLGIMLGAVQNLEPVPASNNSPFGAFVLHGKVELIRVALLCFPPQVLQHLKRETSTVASSSCLEHGSP